MEDPFKKYGGQADTQGGDPFAAYGGKAEVAPEKDPFAAYGGVAEDQPMSQLESAGRGIAQGLAFEFADEGFATTQALAAKTRGDNRPFSQIYDEKVKEQRRLFKKAAEDNPVTYYGSQIASGIAVPGIGWLKGGQTLGSAVKAGVAGGALAGAGSGEDGLVDRATSAAVGAGIGGATGAALYPVAKSLIAFAKPKAPKASIVATEIAKNPTIASKIETRATDLVSKATEADVNNAIAGKDYEFVSFVMGNPKLGQKLAATEQAVESAYQQGKDVPQKLWARALRGQEVLDNFKRVIDQFNPQRQKEIYDDYLFSKAKNEVTAKLNKDFLYGRGANKDPLDVQIMAWLRPASANAARVDEKLGTNFTSAILDFIEAENRLGSDAVPYNKVIENVVSELDKLRGGRDIDEFNREVYKTITEGRFKPGSVYDTIGEFFNFAKSDLNNNYGLNIQPLKDTKGKFYLPRTMMNLEDTQIKLDRMWQKIPKDIPLEQMTPQQQKEAELFQDGIRFLAEKYDLKLPSNVQEVSSFIDNLATLKPTDVSANRLEASAAFARDNEIPPVLIERDIPKLMASYISSNMKAGLYQRALYRLDAEIDIAKALGQNKTADYFEGVRNSLIGVPSARKADMQRRASEWRLRGDRLLRDENTKDNPYLTAVGAFQKTVPDMIPWIMSNMYTNTLALNPYAVVRNITQPFVLGVPDIAKNTGAMYASRNLGKAAMSAVRNLSRESIVNHNKRLGIHKEGPPENVVLKSIVTGLRDAKVPEPIIAAFKGYENLGRRLMTLYSGADDLNRYITAHMADTLSDDMYSKNNAIKQKAFKYLEDMPKPLAQKVLTAYDNNQPEEVRQLIRNYMVLRHQYSYTTADLNRLGREFGSLTTAFTKFPLSVISDIENEIYKRGAGAAFPLTYKYMAPLALLATADYAMQESELKETPGFKLFLGQKFTDMSPVLGVKVGPPPIISAPYKALDVAVKAGSEVGQQPLEEMPEFATETAGKMTRAMSPLIPYYGLYDYTKRRLERAGLIEPEEEE